MISLRRRGGPVTPPRCLERSRPVVPLSRLAGLKPASVKNFHATSSYGTINVRPVGESESASGGDGSKSWL